MSKFWNDKIKEIESYTPGEQPKDKKYIKLNTNENPYPPSAKVIEKIKSMNLEDLKLYPDPDVMELGKVIAEYFSNKIKEEIKNSDYNEDTMEMEIEKVNGKWQFDFDYDYFINEIMNGFNTNDD